MKHFKIKKNRGGYLAMLLFSFSSLINFAQLTPSLVDFDAYEGLVTEVKEHRKSRMLNAEEFVKTSKEEKVIILDTRSDSMYAAAHVKGALHLNFSDFTQDNLAKIIPSQDYKILIYCNNNFESKQLSFNVAQIRDLSPYFVTKMVKPTKFEASLFTSQKIKKAKVKSKSKIKPGPNVNEFEAIEELPASTKPLTLALNIPTYINLYGYGYKNVYELSELVNTNENKLEFEGIAIKK